METLITNTPKARDTEIFRAAKTAIINPDGRLLILWRSPGDDYRPGGADFPGGEIELDESDAEAAIRETCEETGIIINEDNLKQVGCFSKRIDEPDNPIKIIESSLFIAHIHHREVNLGADGEHHAFEWLDPIEIKRRRLLAESLSKLVTLNTVISQQESGEWLPNGTKLEAS